MMQILATINYNDNMQALQWLPGILGMLGPALIPPAHMCVLWLFWQSYARFVDRRFCSCSCWDTVFKGKQIECVYCICAIDKSLDDVKRVHRTSNNFLFPVIMPILGTYESGIASYKHMYFNATQNTMKIWVLTVLAIIALYECTKYLVRLIITNSVRYSMILLFCLSIFSHYYAWWAYINYYNDDFYSQWNHQLFFTVRCLSSIIKKKNIYDQS